MPMPNDKYIEGLNMYVTRFDTSHSGIEWMRFEDDCPISDSVQTVPHIAYEVDNLKLALKGKKVITEPHTIVGGL